MFQCAASTDGKHLAVRRDSTASLYTLDGGLLAEASLVTLEGTVVFVGGMLIDHAVRGDLSILTAFSLPRLKVVASIEIPFTTKLLADNERHLLIASGDNAHIVHLQPTTMTYAPMRVASVATWAVGIPDDQFLVSSNRGLEVWDTASRRPEQKSRMTLPGKLTAVGIAGQRRSLWSARAGSAELTVVRVSDGKVHLIALPAVPSSAIGHPHSSWLVVGLDGASHAVNLVTAACERLPGTRAAAAAVLPRGAGAVVALIDDAGELAVWEIGATEPTPGSTGLQLDLGANAAPAKAPPTTVSAPAKPPKVTTASEAAMMLAPELGVVLHGGPGDREPATVGRFVARGVERGLAAVAAQVRLAWRDLITEDWLTESPRPREEARAHLVAIARSAVLAEPGLAGAVVDERGVQLRGPLLAEQAAAPWTRLAIGPRFELELGGDALAETGRALGSLATAPAQLRAALEEAGVIVPRVSPAFERQLDPGTLATLGGFTVLANLGGVHVLVDPVLRGGASADGVPLPAVIDLPALGGVLLTSDDPAALDVATLLALDKAVPIYAPPASTSGRIKPLLEALGFTSVRTARPGEPIAIGDGKAIPFDPREAGPRYRARIAYALSTRDGAALCCGGLALDDERVAVLAKFAAELARTAPVSPILLCLPARRRAALESGWLWLLDPVDDWLRPTAPAPSLAPLVAAAGATTVVLHRADDVLPALDNLDVRRAEPYDRYRLGAAQDGWLSPRT